MTDLALSSRPDSPPPLRPGNRPLAATAAGVLQLGLGTLTSTAGTVFSLAAGGGWYVAAALFPVALVLWWVAGIGLLRGSRRGHRIGVAMLAALFLFDLMKIVVFHESAAYVFLSATLLIAALQLAAPTRAWSRH